jgi:hypothetical protein
LFRLGVKEAEFSNKLEEDDMFRGICKISLEGVVTCKASGPTIIEGDVKKTAHDAECSAAAKGIQLLERSMGLEFIDVNSSALLVKEELLRVLGCVQKKYSDIQDDISAQWKSMNLQLKGMINYECPFCKQLDLGHNENGSIGCAQMLDEILGDITLLYELATLNCSSVSVCPGL